MKAPYVRTRKLCVSYLRGTGLWRRRFLAVRDVSIDIARNECYALVGESGSGKSTVARALLGLTPIADGTAYVGDFTLPGLKRRERRAFRREVQVVFQDPYLSLNPRLSVGSLIEEPLRIHGVARAQRRERVAEVVTKVRLDPGLLRHRPAELSGGQRQRVCIARALVLRPRFLIADEPVSALDLSVQASIIDLLGDLKEQEGLTMLFVSHDMELVQFIADRVGVMYAGTLVEEGPPADLFANPAHPYTQSLLSAVPTRLAGTDLAAPEDTIRRPPKDAGCRYYDNCAQGDMKCRFDRPPLIMVTPDHRAACYKRRRE